MTTTTDRNQLKNIDLMFNNYAFNSNGSTAGESADIFSKMFEKSLLQHCCDILFAEQDERFLVFALNRIPNVRFHLYKINSSGWFPIFRILNLFQ